MTGKPDDNSARLKREALWKSYVFEFVSAESDTSEARLAAALEVLQFTKLIYEEASRNGDEQKAATCQSRARAVWTLVTHELGDWFFSSFDVGIDDPENFKLSQRAALFFQLGMFQGTFPPTHREGFSYIPVILPQWLFHKLRNGLEALDKGEVHSIFAPVEDGRHDHAWTWDEMRILALQHVAFQMGQGLSIGAARARVATVTGTAAETIRKWERELRSIDTNVADRVETARAAGELKVLDDNDPGHGGDRDAHAQALLEGFRRVPLAEFGRRYQERFGRRHFSQTEPGGN